MRAKEAIARIQGGLDYYPENHEDLVEYIYDLAQRAEEHQECRRCATTAKIANPPGPDSDPSVEGSAAFYKEGRDLIAAENVRLRGIILQLKNGFYGPDTNPASISDDDFLTAVLNYWDRYSYRETERLKKEVDRLTAELANLKAYQLMVAYDPNQLHDAGIAARDLVIADLRKEKEALQQQLRWMTARKYTGIDECPSKQEVS